MRKNQRIKEINFDYLINFRRGDRRPEGRSQGLRSGELGGRSGSNNQKSINFDSFDFLIN